MGFFSNLFKKKEHTQPAPAIKINVNASVVVNDPDIPPLQGDYAKMPDTFCMSAELETLPNITTNSLLPAILKKHPLSNP